MPDTASTAKQAIRSALRARRRAMHSAVVVEASRTITERVLAHIESLPRSEWVLAYAGGPDNEVPTIDLLDALSAKGHIVLLPIPIPGKERTMRWARYTGREALVPGAFDIPEPPADSIVDGPIPRTAPVLVPGIGYDPAGTRLGFGAGYYDRFLAGHDGVRIAPAYDFQVVEHIHREGHDIPMDVIITEKRVIRCGASSYR